MISRSYQRDDHTLYQLQVFSHRDACWAGEDFPFRWRERAWERRERNEVLLDGVQLSADALAFE